MSISNNWPGTKIRVRSATKAAIQKAFPGKTLDSAIQELLAAAGHAVSVLDGPPPVPRETKYKALESCLVNQTMRVLWHGPKDQRTGMPTDTQQSAVYMAVLRCERKTGFTFTREQSALGLKVTRIR